MVKQMGVQDDLPLTETTLFILLSLAPGPKHGYAMIKDVHRLSRERISLSTGTLYGAIKRLLMQGWITRVSGGEQTSGDTAHPGRPRKAYVLTDRGRRVLDAEIERLRALIAVAQLRTAEGRI